MIYVACPYWDPVEVVRDERRAAAARYCRELFRRGLHFYNPLAHSAEYKKSTTKEGYWLEHGRKMVNICTEMHVLCIDGWQQSRGVAGEIEAAKAAGFPVVYIENVARVSFHGSRSLSLATCAPLINDAFQRLRPSTVVTHGEASGACAWVRKMARDQGRSLMLHHLDKAGHAQGAWHWRSVAVLDDSDLAVFLWDGQSQGCSNEMALAEKMGKRSIAWLITTDGAREIDISDALRGVAGAPAATPSAALAAWLDDDDA